MNNIRSLNIHTSSTSILIKHIPRDFSALSSPGCPPPCRKPCTRSSNRCCFQRPIGPRWPASPRLGPRPSKLRTGRNGSVVESLRFVLFFFKQWNWGVRSWAADVFLMAQWRIWGFEVLYCCFTYVNFHGFLQSLLAQGMTKFPLRLISLDSFHSYLQLVNCRLRTTFLKTYLCTSDKKGHHLVSCYQTTSSTSVWILICTWSFCVFFLLKPGI